MTDAAPFYAPDPRDLAALFPGYAIHKLIACGGMGAVYHASQIALDREVAIKILPREFSSDEAFRDGFAAEAKAMAKMNHPNLVGVYDFGEADGMLFIIMEFVPGQSLYHSAYQTAVDPREAARLMSEICAGIAEAHRHGILHRDIKPANVLLDGHNRPKIGDFGLARPIGTAAKEGEVIFGTPHYTAPEVVNNPNHVDARADVFSLGVVLHELLTGKLPANDPRPPSAICGCSPKFDAIVKRATQSVPALRYPDAAAMGRDLAELVVAPAPSHAGGARPPAVRRPHAQHTVVKSSGGGGIGWIVLVLVLGAAAYYVYTIRKTPVVVPAPTDVKPAPRREITNLPVPKKANEQAKPELPPPSDESPPEKSRIFDTPVEGQFGTAMPERPKAEGPKSVFDVDGFLAKARGIMRTKADSVRKVRDRALAENIGRFDREVSRSARDIDREAVNAVSQAMKEIRAGGNRIPDVFAIPGLPDTAYAEPFAEAVKRQDEADAAYVAALKPHAASYILGIELQIGRLQAANDPGAVSLLKEEIELTKSDEEHFPAVLEK